MRGSIPLVEPVSLVEPIDHAVHAWSAVDVERRRTSTGPRLQVQLAEVADVIRMEVSEQHAANRRHRYAPEHEVLDRFRSHVHDVELPAREHRDARFRAAGAREWCRRTAD